MLIGPNTLAVLSGYTTSTISPQERQTLERIINTHDELLAAADTVAFEGIQAAEYAGEEIPTRYIRLRDAVEKAREF